MKKIICSILVAGMLVSVGVTPKAEAGGILGALMSGFGGYQQYSNYDAWTTSANLRIGNIYKGELPSEAYRQKFSVKGTSYLRTIENRGVISEHMRRVNNSFNDLEYITAAYNNGASYYLETKGTKKVIKKTLEIDGFKYEKNKRVNSVADDSGLKQFGIREYYYLYKDSIPYIKDKEVGKKLPIRCNFVQLLGKEYIAEVYNFGDEDIIEFWYFFDVNTKKLKMMGFNFYDDAHKLKLSKLRDVIEFSTEIPDMSVFEIPKKYQTVTQE